MRLRGQTRTESGWTELEKGHGWLALGARPRDRPGQPRASAGLGGSPLEHTKHQLTLTCAWCLLPFRAVTWFVQMMLLDAITEQPAARHASPPW